MVLTITITLMKKKYGTSHLKARSNKHVRERLILSDVSKLFHSNRFEIKTK